MEQLSSIVGFLENKTVLITGSTGFVAKEVLRIQPKVKKLFLLLRAKDSASASARLYDEILNKELFMVVKEKWVSDLSNLISERVTMPVAGDISCEDLGVKEDQLKNEMWNEVDVVVNLAATVNFDERYDVALAINTMGPKHILNFAKKCINSKAFIHVSTGVMKEIPFKMGETLNGTFNLDINLEFKAAITAAMKDFGNKRAQTFGWPNTYVFTKAMGEMLIGESRGSMSLVILRWIEGVRTIDSLAIAYGKGRMECFLGDPNSTIDLIPADMMVSSIIVAIAAHADRPSESIYQIGSSNRNPLKYSSIPLWGHIYFSHNPWIGILYKFKADDVVMRLVQLYRPYLFFKAIFDDKNTSKLRAAARNSMDSADVFHFQFDPKTIDWEDYMMNVHFPGAVTHLFK
uniref:Fatty acyl-CoA reductase n=1 Tax=Kalanchoe fedtschenkoi TaxID=63787 RepID=A0A7N0SW67_KALFE